jgi:rhodanese-related sulfurtransferase
MVCAIMEIVALGIAILALLSAWSTRTKLTELSDQLATLRSSASGGESQGGEDLSRQVSMNTRFLARLAGGESLGPEQVREGRLWADVSPEEAELLVERGVRIVDVRTPNETAAGIIPGAILIPVDELQQRAGELPRDHATTLVYCAMGVRSAAACQFLAELGYDGLVNLDGGFGRWNGPKERPV